MAPAVGLEDSSGPLLSIEGLDVTYGGVGRAVTAVRELSFEIARGEIFGLVGESGSGKSSVCGALMGLLPGNARVTARRMQFNGADLAGRSEKEMQRMRGREMALIPQRPMTSLAPATSVGSQLEWHLGRSLDHPTITRALDSIGLGPVLDRRTELPSRFSGGQLQRLLIALAALAHEPRLLLADEPTTTLDATVQRQVLALLLEVRDRMGLSILYVSHDLSVIAEICDRVGVMYGGRLVEVATVDQLFRAPRHPYSRALVETMPANWTRGTRASTIRGSAAGSNLLAGCPFTPRCPVAEDCCTADAPDPLVSGGSMVACHHVAHRTERP